MATGDIAIPSFKWLVMKAQIVDSNAEVVGLFTQPDRVAGRKKLLTAPAIKGEALLHDVPVFQPEKMSSDEAFETLQSLNPDLIIVMAYGQILTERVIQLPPMGCINVHASLLPRHRGASCIAATIREGDRSTGLTIMHVVKRLDAGDIIRSLEIPLLGIETGESLHNNLAEMAPPLLMDTIHSIKNGTAKRIPQDDSLATYAPKLKRCDGWIDWSLPAVQIERMIRAYHPWPGAFTYVAREDWKIPRKLKILPQAKVSRRSAPVEPGTVIELTEQGLHVACGEGSLIIGEVRPDGGGNMKMKQFISRRTVSPGMVLLSKDDPRVPQQ
jgi:methionyl-tRNA formyltransferase